MSILKHPILQYIETHWPQFHTFHLPLAVWWLSSKDVADESSKDAVAPANAAGEGSFSRLTHAAEFYASQAATQAAGLFSYKTGDEKSQERTAQGWWFGGEKYDNVGPP